MWAFQKAVIRGDAESEQVGKAAERIGNLSNGLMLLQHKVAVEPPDKSEKQTQRAGGGC